MIDLDEIRARNENWRAFFVHDAHCQECGAGQEGHVSPADIDALIVEVECLRAIIGKGASNLAGRVR